MNYIKSRTINRNLLYFLKNLNSPINRDFNVRMILEREKDKSLFVKKLTQNLFFAPIDDWRERQATGGGVNSLLIVGLHGEEVKRVRNRESSRLSQVKSHTWAEWVFFPPPSRMTANASYSIRRSAESHTHTHSLTCTTLTLIYSRHTYTSACIGWPSIQENS